MSQPDPAVAPRAGALTDEEQMARVSREAMRMPLNEWIARAEAAEKQLQRVEAEKAQLTARLTKAEDAMDWQHEKLGEAEARCAEWQRLADVRERNVSHTWKQMMTAESNLAVQTARAEAAEARWKRLLEYTQHKRECGHWRQKLYDVPTGKCDCGLADALAQTKESK